MFEQLFLEASSVVAEAMSYVREGDLGICDAHLGTVNRLVRDFCEKYDLPYTRLRFEMVSIR